ncbi:aminotransferase class V-fold PLP-dependent enzyme [Brenneria uluponensis]|uniref:aminotransferase class V-fold PLP-dependent enzyme n=1 Tax=Brenneria uluponensis TaxID=3057057 RepID=UPI0028F118C4|nr:aminotransferase class V-fold PLP-dependent enzyme [Brenneria ulupoensis]
MPLFSNDIQNYCVTVSSGEKVKYINLDNAATTPPFRSVQEKVNRYLNIYGSVHRGAGEKSKISTDQYEISRDVIKKFVNASSDYYVLYTGNTTGAMNAAAYFFSFLQGKVAVSGIEHSSSWLPWVKAEGIKKLGARQVVLSELKSCNDEIQKLGREQVLQYEVNDFFEFDLSSVKKVFANNNIKVFILTASSNATGYCPDIKAIGEIVHQHGAFFVVDACQFIQHHKIDMQDMGIDFLAASGHKFYAPYGGGFLVGPKSFFDQFISYEIGGGNLPYITADGEFLRYQNQMAHDPGTPNAVGAIAMASAIEKIQELGLDYIEQYEKKLALMAFNALKEMANVEVYVSEKHLSTVIPFNIKGIKELDVANRLNDEFGIGVRAGSFCVYNVVRKLLCIHDESEIISNVKAGIENSVPGFIRASISLCNDQRDIERFIEAIEKISNSVNSSNPGFLAELYEV